MTKPTRQDVEKATKEYVEVLANYRKLVEKEEITPATEMLAAYDKVNEAHKRYMEISRLYVIWKLQPKD